MSITLGQCPGCGGMIEPGLGFVPDPVEGFYCMSGDPCVVFFVAADGSVIVTPSGDVIEPLFLQ